MKKDIKKILINKINKSLWWHVTPRDPKSYEKKGKFLASTFHMAEFYGRPNDIPERVQISNPLYGASEKEVLKVLFPAEYNDLICDLGDNDEGWYIRRVELDSKIYEKAKILGFDSVVLFGTNGEKYLMNNRKPNSIELNLCK